MKGAEENAHVPHELVNVHQPIHDCKTVLRELLGLFSDEAVPSNPWGMEIAQAPVRDKTKSFSSMASKGKELSDYGEM